jgi:hypothetical protein
LPGLACLVIKEILNKKFAISKQLRKLHRCGCCRYELRGENKEDDENKIKKELGADST